MWLFTQVGFFSIVKKDGEGIVTVRSRSRSDMVQLCKQYLPKYSDKIHASEETDYRYRIFVDQNEFARVAAQLVQDIDYPNFKNRVHTAQGPNRAHCYADVWSAVYRLQQQE